MRSDIDKWDDVEMVYTKNSYMTLLTQYQDLLKRTGNVLSLRQFKTAVKDLLDPIRGVDRRTLVKWLADEPIRPKSVARIEAILREKGMHP